VDPPERPHRGGRRVRRPVAELGLQVVKSVSYGIPGLPWYLVLLSPAIGAFLAGLIMERYTPETAGQGMSCVIDALNYHGGEIRPLTSPIKLIVTSLTVGSGGSGGREGPIAQICGGLATYLARPLKLRREDLKILVICSISAGTSAVFHAPIGGAIFALELPYKNDLRGGPSSPPHFPAWPPTSCTFPSSAPRRCSPCPRP
jgi:H+/Cl- antiporter ClcA